MSTTEITSREYKLMLSTTRFRDRDSASREWMELVARVIGRAGGTRLSQQDVENEIGAEKKKDPDKVDESGVKEKKRTTFFLDTADNGFRRQGWIVRVRRKKKDKLDLTVKFRCPDRLLAASKDASSTQEGEGKFEEDIVPPFASQYSRSNTLEDRAGDMVPRSVAEAAALFPALGELGIVPETPLVVVDGLEVREVVLHVGGIRFGNGPRLEMSHAFWYVGESETKTRYPMVAEFSFEFEPTGGDFPLETVKGASEVYRELQAQAGWLDVAGTTKSALVSGGV